LTVLDVTTQTYHQQRIQQQRNETQLLTAQLNNANELLAFLLKRFVPEPVAKELIASNRVPELGREIEREATVLFADMRGFTGLAENLAPDAVLDLLNDYLGVVAQAVLRHEGTLVQVVGDMVMGVFNLPALQPDHAQLAVEASLDIRRSLEQYTGQKGGGEAPLPVGFGIGISTGRVVAGYLGLRQRYRYAVVGDTTNVAFYLCSQAAAGEIILCQSTVNASANGPAALRPGIVLVPRGEVWPKRRRQAVMTYALIGEL
jgi:adenylate cyclase